MNRKHILALAVLGSGVGLAAWRHHHRPRPIQQAAVQGQATVLLFADLGEADSSCGCGDIIRAVREAHSRGWALQELEPGSQDPRVARFRLATSPTVVLLDPNGLETARFEGEGDHTLADLQARLHTLVGKPR